jgi:hypothetical protein
MEETYKKKYLKYKQKYLDLKGGMLQSHENYNLIESIGFEFECSQLSLFYGDITEDLLTLTPFGYNENSIDSTQNRSLIKVNLGKIETEHGMGEFIMSQDSYELFENTKEQFISYQEALTLELDKKEKIFNLSNSNTNIKNIKLHIDSSKHLTIGDTELMITFLSLNNKNNNLIINLTEKIYDSIETLFSNENVMYIGDINIQFNDFFRDRKKIFTDRINKNFNIFKLKNYKVNEKDIYLFTFYNTINDLNKYIKWNPQITFGCKLINFYRLIDTLTEYTYSDPVKTEINIFIDFIEEFTLKEDFHSIYDMNLIRNYLLLLCLYIFRLPYEAYTIKDKHIDIHKFTTPVLPRQNFYEIIKRNNLEYIFPIFNKYSKIILLFIIRFMRKLFELERVDISVIEKYFIMNNIKLLSIDNIDEKFLDFVFSDYVLYEEKKHKIKEIVINMFKTFTQYNEKDLFTTFTTKIPYEENIIFEYRDIFSNIIQKISELQQQDILSNDITYEPTLETFRLINSYNKHIK